METSARLLLFQRGRERSFRIETISDGSAHAATTTEPSRLVPHPPAPGETPVHVHLTSRIYSMERIEACLHADLSLELESGERFRFDAHRIWLLDREADAIFSERREPIPWCGGIEPAFPPL
jgi:hypothetical protein